MATKGFASHTKVKPATHCILCNAVLSHGEDPVWDTTNPKCSSCRDIPKVKRTVSK